MISRVKLFVSQLFTPTAILVRQVLGAFVQFEKATTWRRRAGASA
jgi:hypothetical protein